MRSCQGIKAVYYIFQDEEYCRQKGSAVDLSFHDHYLPPGEHLPGSSTRFAGGRHRLNLTLGAFIVLSWPQLFAVSADIRFQEESRSTPSESFGIDSPTAQTDEWSLETNSKGEVCSQVVEEGLRGQVDNETIFFWNYLMEFCEEKFFVEEQVLDLKFSVYFLHFSKCGGTTFCRLANTIYKIAPIAKPRTNCNLPGALLTLYINLSFFWIALSTPVPDKACEGCILIVDLPLNPPVKFTAGNSLDARKSGGPRKRQLALFKTYNKFRFFANEGLMPPEGQEIFGGPVAYVTILRDPVQRAASRWAMFQRHHPTRAKNFRDLEDFLRAGQWDQVELSQVQALSGFSGNRTNLTTAHLEVAKRRLQHFSVVFCTERYNEGIQLMRHKFGWTKEVVHKNKSEKKLNITAAERDLMSEMFALDMVISQAQARAMHHVQQQMIPKVATTELYAFGNQLLSAQLRFMRTEMALWGQGRLKHDLVTPMRRRGRTDYRFKRRKERVKREKDLDEYEYEPHEVDNTE
eukprot:gene3969-4941_t